LHQFSRDGVVLLGHLRDAREGRLIIAPDVKDTLAKVDQFEADALKRVDGYVARTGLSVPSETIPQLRYGYDQDVITELDLKGSGISTVALGDGYNFDFSLVSCQLSMRMSIPSRSEESRTTKGCTFSECLASQPTVGNPVRCRRRCRLSGSHIAARDRESSAVVA